MRTTGVDGVDDELLKILREKTLAQYRKMQILYPKLFLPFGIDERENWNRWRRKSDWGDLAGMVRDVSVKIQFRARALLLVLSPILVEGRKRIPWTVRGKVELTRVFTGAEDYLDHGDRLIFSPGDESLIELALSFMEGFQELPMSLVERTLVNYSVLRRHILSILPETSPLALRAFEGYRFFDYSLCKELFRYPKHILTPLDLLLVRGSIPEKWRLLADETVWQEMVRQRTSQWGAELWGGYIGIVDRGLSCQPRSDEELPEKRYPLRVLRQQLEHVWSVDPEKFLSVSNADRFLGVFYEGGDELRNFGARLFRKIICSKEAAFLLFSQAESMCPSLENMAAGLVVTDALKKLGESDDRYERRLRGWLEAWLREKEKRALAERKGRKKETARKQALCGKAG